MALEWEISSGWRNSSFYNYGTKKDSITLDVFVADAPRIDQSLFNMWLEGLRAKDAAHKKEKNSGVHEPLMYDIVYRDVLDQYRLFDMLEYYLQNPDVFSVQHIVQIDMSVFRSLLEKYYEINEAVIRELVGKKFTQKLRSSLDDLSDRLKINVKVCRRVFDNMKRLYIYTIENRGILSEYSIVDILHQHFKLSKPLSLKYARHIFLFYHRIESSDKNLRFLNAADFEYFASVLMNQWTSDKQQLDLDKKFKEDIRDCRTHLLSDKNILDNYKQLVFEQIKSDKKTDKKLSNLATKFQVILKALLNIGAGISKSKEFEDIVEDLEDKILDTIISIGLSKSHVDDFFTYLCQTFDPLLDTMTFTRHRQRFSKSWLRYLDGIRLSLLHMYDKKLLEERDK